MATTAKNGCLKRWPGWKEAYFSRLHDGGSVRALAEGGAINSTTVSQRSYFGGNDDILKIIVGDFISLVF